MFGSIVSAQERYAFERTLPAGSYALEQDLFLSVIVTMDRQSSRVQEKAKLFWMIDVSPSENGAGPRTEMKLRRIMFQSRDDTRGLSELMYDSDHRVSAGDPLRAFFEGLLAARFSVTLKNDFSVESVTVPDGFPESVVSGEFADNSEIAQILPSVRSLLSKKTLSETFDQMFYLLPEKDVAVGEQWTNQTGSDLPVLGKTSIRWESRLKELSKRQGRPQAVITGTSQVALDDQTNINIEMTNSYDVETGLCVKAVSRSVVSKTRPVTLQGVEKKAKTIGMVRSFQTLTPNESWPKKPE